MKKYTLLFAGCLQLLCFSCEELIDVDLPTTQLNTPMVYTDAATAKAALASLYSATRDDSFVNGGMYGIGFMTGVYTDELTSYLSDSHNLNAFYDNQILSTNSAVSKLWDSSYKTIYAINLFIENMRKSTSISEEDKNTMIGEALFLRALYYYYLTVVFGDIPHTTTTDYTINKSLNKTPVSQIFVLNQTDLVEASSLLKETYRNQERVYPNLYAVKLLLARQYAELEQWDNVQKELNLILNSSNYGLRNEPKEVFNKSYKGVIWQLKPDTALKSTFEADLYNSTSFPPSSASISNQIIQKFEMTDLRKTQWIKTIFNETSTYSLPAKYKNKNGENSTEYSNVMRIEEAYFLMAEAQINKENINAGIELINQIRERSGLSKINTIRNKEEAIDWLLEEKEKEFFSEFGHRFLDLKRNNRFNQLQLIKPNWKSFHNVLPLPQKELLLNPNLNPQNEGY
ncbi:hypothetical protein AS589_07400 [Empedobacter brevis]|uniref:RagB/SusD family nutrient uptake outer membrane protein n=1 Tax=Empedobacter brevis TaxID=247 RepID=UPI0013205603|nr:RagB/SusD family nutrient uptake outer membrane protein [Empedobacter brevis]QHC84624.1 hypothetical protein AS589_07400 [Empedobacter brevis]